MGDAGSDVEAPGELSRRTTVGRLTIYTGLTICGIVGAYLPVVLFHVSGFSLLSLVCSFAGGIVGAWLG